MAAARRIIAGQFIQQATSGARARIACTSTAPFASGITSNSPISVCNSSAPRGCSAPTTTSCSAFLRRPLIEHALRFTYARRVAEETTFSLAARFTRFLLLNFLQQRFGVGP